MFLVVEGIPKGIASFLEGVRVRISSIKHILSRLRGKSDEEKKSVGVLCK